MTHLLFLQVVAEIIGEVSVAPRPPLGYFWTPNAKFFAQTP